MKGGSDAVKPQGLAFRPAGARHVRLLVATFNPGKAREIRALLGGLRCSVADLTMFQMSPVTEDGLTYRDNAILKATTYARGSGLLTLADDSGIEVEALGGGPGPRSARYGGEGLSDPERVAALLHELRAEPPPRRARYCCVVAVADPERLLGVVEGTCHGEIALEQSGSGGFGYDPIFFVPHLGQTMAELDPELKDLVSHRGQAVRRARELLEGLT